MFKFNVGISSIFVTSVLCARGSNLLQLPLGGKVRADGIEIFHFFALPTSVEENIELLKSKMKLFKLYVRWTHSYLLATLGENAVALPKPQHKQSLTGSNCFAN